MLTEQAHPLRVPHLVNTRWGSKRNDIFINRSSFPATGQSAESLEFSWQLGSRSREPPPELTAVEAAIEARCFNRPGSLAFQDFQDFQTTRPRDFWLARKDHLHPTA